MSAATPDATKCSVILSFGDFCKVWVIPRCNARNVKRVSYDLSARAGFNNQNQWEQDIIRGLHLPPH